MAPKLGEEDFKRRVIETAQTYGWLVAHFRPARTKTGWRTPVEADGAGFPDLVLARDGVVLLAELKSETGRVDVEQQRWIDALGLYARVWRPRDWDAVLRELSRPRPSRLHRRARTKAPA